MGTQKSRLANMGKLFPKPDLNSAYFNFRIVMYKFMITNPDSKSAWLSKILRDGIIEDAGLEYVEAVEKDDRVYYFRAGKLAYRTQHEQAELDQMKRDRELVMQEYMKLRSQYFSATTLTPGRKLELTKEMDRYKSLLGL